MASTVPFSDRDLYNASIVEAYEINKKIESGDKKITLSNREYDIVDIQHDTQTGFDAMAVKDQAGNVIIVYGGTNMNNGNQDVATYQTFKKV